MLPAARWCTVIKNTWILCDIPHYYILQCRLKGPHATASLRLYRYLWISYSSFLWWLCNVDLWPSDIGYVGYDCLRGHENLLVIYWYELTCWAGEMIHCYNVASWHWKVILGKSSCYRSWQFYFFFGVVFWSGIKVAWRKWKVSIDCILFILVQVNIHQEFFNTG